MYPAKILGEWNKQTKSGRVFSECSNQGQDMEVKKLKLMIEQLKKEKSELKSQLREAEDFGGLRARIAKLEEQLVEQDRQLSMNQTKSNQLTQQLKIENKRLLYVIQQQEAVIKQNSIKSQRIDKVASVEGLIQGQKEIKSQQSYSEEEHRKYGILIQERNQLKDTLQSLASDLQKLAAKAAFRNQNIDETEQSEELYQEFLRSQKNVQLMLRNLI